MGGREWERTFWGREPSAHRHGSVVVVVVVLAWRCGGDTLSCSWRPLPYQVLSWRSGHLVGRGGAVLSGSWALAVPGPAAACVERTMERKENLFCEEENSQVVWTYPPALRLRPQRPESPCSRECVGVCAHLCMSVCVFLLESFESEGSCWPYHLPVFTRVILFSQQEMAGS